MNDNEGSRSGGGATAVAQWRPPRWMAHCCVSTDWSQHVQPVRDDRDGRWTQGIASLKRGRALTSYKSNSPCRTPSRKIRHSSRLNRSTGPATSLESLTRTSIPMKAISTQVWSAPWLKLLRRQVAAMGGENGRQGGVVIATADRAQALNGQTAAQQPSNLWLVGAAGVAIARMAAAAS